MANDAKKVSQLGIATTLSANDRVVVLTNPASSAQTQTISLSNLITNSSSVRANTSSYGVVKIGSGLSVNATGFLNGNNSANTGTITFSNNIISSSANNEDITIRPLGSGYTLLDRVVFQQFANTSTAIWYRDANTAGKYGGQGNSSIYLDIAAILNDSGDYVIKGDGRFRYIANDEVAIQNTDFGHVILRTENNDKFIKVHNVTDEVGLELRTDEHTIIIVPNNYMWEFTTQGVLNIPDDVGDIQRNGVSVLGVPPMLSPNIAYTGVFNGYPGSFAVTKGEAVFFTSNGYVLDTANKYWLKFSFYTGDYDLSGVETLDFRNLGGIGVDFSLGGKSENLLTDVNLHDIAAIGDDFYIRDLPALETFSANNLVYVNGNFQIDTMDNANTQFNFPNLDRVGYFYYTYNNVLENTPQFPALKTCSNMYMYYNSATQNTMTFDSLEYVGFMSIYQNSGMVDGPDFAALVAADYIDMNNNNNMINPPTFPVLVTVNSNFYFYEHDEVLSAPALPSLITANYIQISNNPSMVDGYDFSSLVTVNSSINFDNNTALTESPTFPLLQTLDGTFTMDNNPLLTSGLSFPSLKTFNGNFSVNGCGFNETTINSLLVKLASLDGTGGTTSYDNRSVYVNGGTNAVPTGAGLAAITTLEGRGCTVYKNT